MRQKPFWSEKQQSEMAIKIKLKEDQTNAIQKIAELGPEKLVQILDALRNEEVRKPLGHKQLTRFIATIIERANAELLTSQLVSLGSLIIRTNEKPQAVVEAIDEQLTEMNTSGRFPKLDQWRIVYESFLRLLESPEIRRVSMALSLNYDYANLLHRAKILTDIRPIFSESADRIEACVVSYTMRVHYSTGDGNRELSIALDYADVESLKSQCDRALKKSETAKASMQDAGIQTEISGEDKGDSE